MQAIRNFREWCRNIYVAVSTLIQGMYVTMRTMIWTYRRKTFTEVFEYPEVPVPVKARYRGFHRFDLIPEELDTEEAQARDVPDGRLDILRVFHRTNGGPRPCRTTTGRRGNRSRATSSPTGASPAAT